MRQSLLETSKLSELIFDVDEIYSEFSSTGVVQVQYEISQLHAVVREFSQHDYLNISEDTISYVQDVQVRFNDHLSKIDTDILKYLRETLFNCHLQSDRIRIFTLVSPLFNKLALRSLLHEYQNEIFKYVLSLVKSLRQTHVKNQGDTDFCRLWRTKASFGFHASTVHARCVVKRTRYWLSYLRRIFPEQPMDDSTLGGSISDLEGFINRIDPSHTVPPYLAQFLTENLSIQGFLLSIHVRDDGGFDLRAELPTTRSHLIDEIRNFAWLGFPIPFALMTFYKRLRKIDMFFRVIQNCLDFYRQLSWIVESNTNISILTQLARSRTHSAILGGKLCEELE